MAKQSRLGTSGTSDAGDRAIAVRDGKKSWRETWRALGIPTLSAIIAVVSIVATSWSANRAIDANSAVAQTTIRADRALAERADRVSAYSSVTAVMVQTNEFAWANVWWAGNDVNADRPADYWERAQDLSAQLESAISMASMLTRDNGSGVKVNATLQHIRDLQDERSRSFECMTAEAQQSLDAVSTETTDRCKVNGEQVLPATQGEIRGMLEDWAEEWGAAKRTLIEASRHAVSTD